MCSQVTYSVIEEIRFLLPQWSLLAKFEYSIIFGGVMICLEIGRSKREGVKLRDERLKIVTRESPSH